MYYNGIWETLITCFSTLNPSMTMTNRSIHSKRLFLWPKRPKARMGRRFSAHLACLLPMVGACHVDEPGADENVRSRNMRPWKILTSSTEILAIK